MKYRFGAVVILVLAVACACDGHERLTTGLHVTITNVGWNEVNDGVWRTTGARVDVDCEAGKMVVDAGDAERSAAPSVGAVCAAIRKDPGLLHGSREAASECAYYCGTVRVTGTWDGREINLAFPTSERTRAGRSEDIGTDPGARWAHMLGFHFQGPDPPA
jgi:hypothetical protein